MPIPGNLLTTAMAVMPHVNVDRALEKALSLEKAFETIKLISGELREKYLGYKWRCNK